MIPIRFLQDPHQISPKKSIKKTLGIFKNETPTLAKHFILQNVMLILIMHCMCSFNYTKNFFKYLGPMVSSDLTLGPLSQNIPPFWVLILCIKW